MIDSTAVIIVDFDNRFPGDIYAYPATEIEFLLKNTISTIYRTEPNVKYIKIRLYGGWYSGSNLTNRASALLSYMASFDLFPLILRERKIDGDIEMVKSLFESGYIWGDTYKERRGLPRVRIDHGSKGDLCDANKQQCPLHVLYKIMKNKHTPCHIDGCTTICQNVFFRREQKMVDTMIACDIILLAEKEEVECIYLISDDIDHLPSIAVCRSKRLTMPITVMLQNSQSVSAYADIYNNFTINTLLLP
jgi:uncharacterized LabA/DUF88 family protein